MVRCRSSSQLSEPRLSWMIVVTARNLRCDFIAPIAKMIRQQDQRA